MPSKRQAANRKNSQRSVAAARKKRMSILLRRRKPLISIDVLRALATLNLPNDKRIYTAKLNELLGT